MIAVTGASGKTGGIVAEALIRKGEKIRVIGRSADHLQHLTERGAQPMIGDVSNAEFLTQAFSGVEGAYVIIPPKLDAPDIRQYYNTMGAVIIEAIKRSGLRRLVFLSSLGAERDSGTGPVLGLHDVEKALDMLSDVDIIFLRPAFFFENMLMYADQIKHRQVYANSADPDALMFLVAAKDIGNKAADFLFERRFKGHTVEELFGDRISFREMIKILGKKLEVPTLHYEQISGGEALQGMMSMGLSKSVAEAFVDLGTAMSGNLISPIMLRPEKPNAPTTYRNFVDEVYYPVFKKTA